jgi:integrase
MQCRHAKAGDELHDGNNLVLRVGKGRRTWNLVWRADGKVRKVRLGEYPTVGVSAARTLAQDGMGRIRQKLDPIVAPASAILPVAEVSAPKTKRIAPKPVGPTVKDMLATYLQRHVTPTAKDPKQIEWVIDRLLEPLHARPLADLRRTNITQFLDETADERGPSSAYRAGSILRAAFRFAIKRGDIEIDPTWSRLARVLLLTGLRLREAADAPATEIDDAWRIPRERMKGDRAHLVPMFPALTVEIGDLKGVKWLFRSPRRFDQPVRGFSRGLAAIQTSAGTSDDWTWHDLRRSCASGMQRLGAPSEVIEAVLAHRRPGVSSIYQRHDFLAERLEWLTRWSEYCGEPTKM